MKGGDRSTATVTRRSFLRTAGGATAAAATAGAVAGQDGTTTGNGTAGNGTTGNGTAENGTAGGGNQTDGNATAGGGGGGGGETHTVDMTDDLVFDPEEVTVAPGDTVEWVNVGQVEHSVTGYEEEIPDGAEYFASGGFESEQAARDAYPDEGAIAAEESYTHTFETAGEFGYFCIPHETVGMVGTVVVQEGGGAQEGGGEAAGPAIPDSAKTLGIISVSALLSVLSLAYIFLKYGGDYGEVEA